MVQENNYNRIQALRTVGQGLNVGQYAIGDATPEECLELLLENSDVNVLTDAEYAQLDGFVSLTPAENDFYQFKSGNWVNRTIAQVKADLAINNVDNTTDLLKPLSTASINALALKADLVAGKVPASQLPSYVDDVEEYANVASFPVTGESGKLYIDLSITPYPTYRWTGTIYAPVGNTLALGETSTTAYRGDRGKIAYDHSQTTHDKAFVGLGNVDNTSDVNKPVSTAQQTALDLKANKAGDTFTGNMAFEGSANLFGVNANPFTARVSIDKAGNDSLVLTDDTAIASGVGGGIFFGGKYTGTTKTTWASIVGLKETGVDGEFGGYLRFLTRPHAGIHTARMDITPSGVIDLLMGQLKFPAIQNPSADANTLDDYEEGNFTPGVTFGGGSTGMVFGQRTGKYQKIGNRVFFDLYFYFTNKGSSVGSARVTGLPFTSSNATTFYYSINIGIFNGMTYTGRRNAFVVNNQTEIQIADDVVGVFTDTNFSNTTEISLSGFYDV